MVSDPGSEQPGSGDEQPAPEPQPPSDVAGQQPQPPAPAGPASDVDIAGWIAAAWRLFTKDIPLSIGIGLVAAVPPVAIGILTYLGFVAMAIAADGHEGPPPAVAIAFGAVVGLLFLALGLTMPALQAGVFACFLEGMRTGRLTSQQLWRGFSQWWACTWLSWVVTAAMMFCFPFVFLLVGIPVVVGLSTLWWISLFHIVDTGEGGVAALSFAWNALRPRVWALLVFTLLAITIMNGGIMAMYIGFIVTVPIGAAALAAGYDALKRAGEEQSLATDERG